MNRRLIDYNPEGHGADGEALLFGVRPSRSPAVSREIAELAFTSAFLDADSLVSLKALIKRLMRYASIRTGRPITRELMSALAPRLGRAASVIWRLLDTHKITPPGGGSESATLAAERISAPNSKA